VNNIPAKDPKYTHTHYTSVSICIITSQRPQWDTYDVALREVGR